MTRGDVNKIIPEVLHEAFLKEVMKVEMRPQEHGVLFVLKAQAITGGPYLTVHTKFVQTSEIEQQVRIV